MRTGLPPAASGRPRRARRRCALACAAAGALTLTVDGPCRANGRFPSANQLVFAPSDPQLIVLRTTYGILPSHDDGATWGYICEEALGLDPGAGEDPSLAVSAHSLIAGHVAGLEISPDVGCNWVCQGGPLAGLPVVDVALRPDSPRSAVAVTSAFQESDSAVYNIDSRVFETTDDGATWTQLGSPLPGDLVIATIDVTKTDSARLYVSGTRGNGSTTSAWLFVSMDRGSTWQGAQMPPSAFDSNEESSVYIGGVDPRNAGRLYLRSRSSPFSAGGRSRLTAVDVTPNGAPLFRNAYSFDAGGSTDSAGEMLGFAVSADGSRLYIGSQADGLWAASSADLVFQKRSSIAIGCLATRGSELWACSTTASGFIVGMSSDDGATFAPKLSRVGALTGPIACTPDPRGAACGASQNGSLCAEAWDGFCQTVPCGIDGGGTASAPDAGGPSSSPGPAPSASCATGHTSSHMLFDAGRAVALLGAGVAAAGHDDASGERPATALGRRASDHSWIRCRPSRNIGRRSWPSPIECSGTSGGPRTPCRMPGSDGKIMPTP